MSEKIPLRLKLVAIECIFAGVTSAVAVVYPLFHNHINIDFGIVLLPIGIGLLRLNRVAHKWAIIFSWLQLVAALILFCSLFLLPDQMNLTFRLMGLPMLEVSPRLGIVLFPISVTVLYWRHSVLNSQGIRRLFGKHSRGNN